MNGTIGKVSELGDDKIQVTLESGKTIDVKEVTWDNVKSKYNRQTHKMETQVVGTFTQYPLKLAWTITIHRSQGMTFERMHFDLSHGTFLPGQAYVAISRLRSLKYFFLWACLFFQKMFPVRVFLTKCLKCRLL